MWCEPLYRISTQMSKTFDLVLSCGVNWKDIYNGAIADPISSQPSVEGLYLMHVLVS